MKVIITSTIPAPRNDEFVEEYLPIELPTEVGADPVVVPDDPSTWPMDTRVLVWNDERVGRRERYFAGESEDGKPMCFDDGHSSRTTGDITIWDYAELVK